MSEWYAFIYNPRTKKTRRRIVRSVHAGDMGNARAVCMEAARKYGVSQDHVLAIPKRRRATRHRRSR